jgi:3-(3-hydroxy-phenyl)propionate hydroxylase
LLDPGSQIAQRYACPPDTMVLVRPDDHIAAIAPMAPGAAQAAYHAAISAQHREAVPA